MNSFTRESLLLTFRSLRAIPRVPERILDVTIQPIVFVLLFRYVFGSAIHVHGVTNYSDYLMPGLIAQGLAFGMIGAGVATSHDMAEGVLDRFRSMPVSRLSIVTGQVLGQYVEGVLGLTVYTAIGLVCGWRPSFDAGGALAWVGLMLLGTFAFTWAGAYFGMLVRSPRRDAGCRLHRHLPVGVPRRRLCADSGDGRDAQGDRRMGSDQCAGRHLAQARRRLLGARLVAAVPRRALDGDLVAAAAGDLRPARAAPIQQHGLGLEPVSVAAQSPSLRLLRAWPTSH